MKTGAQLKDSKVFGCERFHALFKENPLRVPSIGADINTLIHDIADQVAMEISKSRETRSRVQQTGSSDILGELEAIGWSNVINIKNDSGSYTLRLSDEFILHVLRSKDLFYGTVEPVVPFWKCSPSKSILLLYKGVMEQLSRYSRLFNLLIELDAELGTQSDTKYSNIRKIYDSNGNWTELRFDPENPNAMPSCFASNRTPLKIHWDSGLALSDNVRKNFGDLGQKAECGICSSVRSPDGKFAENCCRNGDCGARFHLDCLVEWFESDPRTVRSFGQLHGSCPYCDATNTLDL